MKSKIYEFVKSHKVLIIIITFVIIIASILLLSFFSKKDYNIFLEMYMPNDSYGYVVYSPGNNNEFNLYKNSYLNIEYSFSDNKNRDIKYIVDNNEVISIENNKLIAKNIGTAKIYIKTNDNVESNIITVNVVNNNE